MTIEEWLSEGAQQIRSSEAIQLWRPYMARMEAEALLVRALGRAAGESAGEPDAVVPPGAQRRFEGYLARRITGEPAALIIGTISFRGLELRTRAGVFVPRSSSESLAAEAISRITRRKSPVAVDVATGSGPVALAIAAEVKKARVFGVDISPPALSLARANAKRLALSNVTFVAGDVLSGLPEALRRAVDVITVHPPYVAVALMADLPAEIRQFEPETSLTDHSQDGLGLVRRLLDQAPEWLRRGGWLLVEVSPDLSRRVGGLLRRNGYSEVKSHRDSLGATRVIAGRR